MIVRLRGRAIRAAPFRLLRLAVFISIVAVVATASVVVAAQPLLVLPAEPAQRGDLQYDLSPWLEWFDQGDAGPGGEFAIDQAAETRFEPAPAPPGSLGFHASPLWLRLRVANEANVAVPCVLELGLMPDLAELFQQEGTRLVLLARSGADLPFTYRPVWDTRIAFRLTIAAAQSSTFFLRVQSHDVIWTHATLFSEPAFARMTAARGLALGLYYGLLLVMIVYNGFIYVSTRERTYLLYVLFETATLLLQAAFDKIAFQYLWPHSPGWAQRSEQLFSALTVLAAIHFTLAFLDVRRAAPRLARALRTMGVGSALLGIASLITMGGLFLDIMGVFFIACLLAIVATGAIAALKNQPNARFFLLGWMPLLCGAVMAILAGVGLVSPEVGYVAFKIGSAAEATILALALANRINLMRRAREHADAELLAARAAQSSVLEQRVASRTQDLSEAVSRLKLAQDKLLRQERLTSLAGMVAGMAHEMGNPLNFANGGADVLRQQIEDLTRTWQQLGAAAGSSPGSVSQAKAAALPSEVAQMSGLLAGAARAVALVNAGLQRMGKIMTNLRGYMQLRMVESQPTDLIAEIESTLSMLDETLRRQGITVVRHMTPLPLFRCRPGELNQVFMNIVLNACSAMGAGGRIEITSRVDPGADIEIQFADDGPGIPAVNRNAIFEPFFSDRAIAGSHTGLGLYVAREIVARHGGELVLLESERGACFAVRLPSSNEPDQR